jgi:hypothetical protein
MLVSQGFARLDFNNQSAVDEKIGEIFPENRSVFIQYVQGMLLYQSGARFPQPVGETVLIDFLQMPMPMVAVQREARFADVITKTEDFIN